MISRDRGFDDVRLRLDLDEPAHLAVLRSYLHRYGGAALTEADGPSGWIGDRPAELLLTLISTPPRPRRPARPARPSSTAQHWPGRSRWLDARIYGRSRDILTHILARLPDLPSGWWFLRHSDPAPHLRLRVPLHEQGFARSAHGLALWAEQLYDDGLVADYALATYRPETRHGRGPTLAAAEKVFAADSRAALRQLSGDREAAAAAGMIAIADGFTGGHGLRWLVDHVPHRSGPRLDPAQLIRARNAEPEDPEAAELMTALAAYRALADQDELDTDQVLADLLHLHHARVIGIDNASERHCLRLARALAQADFSTGRRTRGAVPEPMSRSS